MQRVRLCRSQANANERWWWQHATRDSFYRPFYFLLCSPRRVFAFCIVFDEGASPSASFPQCAVCPNFRPIYYQFFIIVLFEHNVHYRVLSTTIEYYRVLESTIEYHRVLSSTIEYYRVLSSTIGYYRELLRTIKCIKYYQVLLSSTILYCQTLSHTIFWPNIF